MNIIPSDSGRVSQTDEGLLGTIRLSIDTLDRLKNNGGMLDISLKYITDAGYYLIDTIPQGYVSPYKAKSNNLTHGSHALNSTSPSQESAPKPVQTEPVLEVAPENSNPKAKGESKDLKAYMKNLENRIKEVATLSKTDVNAAIAKFDEVEQKIRQPEVWAVFQSDQKSADKANKNILHAKTSLGCADEGDRLVHQIKALCEQLNLEAGTEFSSRFGVAIANSVVVPNNDLREFIRELSGGEETND